MKTVKVSFEDELWEGNNSRVVNSTAFFYTATELRANPAYVNGLVLVNFAVMTLAPAIVLTTCHLRTYRVIEENTKR